MMRFMNEADRAMLLSELGYNESTDLASLPEEELHEFIKRRSGLIRGAKNQVLSKKAKRAWAKNRNTYMKGIKGFHKSTAGKRMHRQMGRFLATRITKRGVQSSRMLRETLLKALSSMRTHLYIENETYQNLQEQRDLGLLMDYAVPALLELEQRWWSANNDELLVEVHELEMTDEELDMLLCLTHPKAIRQSLFELGYAEDASKVVQEALHHCTITENDVCFVQLIHDKLSGG